MRVMQKVMRIGAVMTHESMQCCAIFVPVLAPQVACVDFIQVQMRHQVLRHGAIDVRKNVRTRIVQRVIEVKNPDPLPMSFTGHESLGSDHRSDAFIGQHFQE